MSNAPKSKQQSSIFRGIYEFEDPSGVLIAAKVPASGSVDLFDGTVLVVRPTQVALFIYQGKVADIFGPGTHELRTGNVPVLTKLANFKLGMQSPLRCELYFFSTQSFLARKWGTAQPVMVKLPNVGMAPLRSFGTYNLKLRDPGAFLQKVVGQAAIYDVSQLDEFVQSHLLEVLPKLLSRVGSFDELEQSREDLGDAIEQSVNRELYEFGIEIEAANVLSLLPSQEIIEAIEAKAAINTIGSQREYMLYKAARSLAEGGQGNNTGNDPMQMMLGMMLGKGLLGKDTLEHAPAGSVEIKSVAKVCPKCSAKVDSTHKFCGHCGGSV